MKLIEVLLLVFPAVGWALYNGRNGLIHPNFNQVIIVSIIMLVGSIWPALHTREWLTIPKALAVSITGYGLFFPPLMNYVLLLTARIKFNLKKLSYRSDIIYCLDKLSPTAWPDKLFLKYRVHWIVRLVIYMVLFVLSLMFFVL